MTAPPPVPQEAVDAARDVNYGARAELHIPPRLLRAMLEAAAPAIRAQAVTAERKRIRDLAASWRKAHWDAGDSMAATAFGNLVRRLDHDEAETSRSEQPR